jgi:hypothetical protein
VWILAALCVIGFVQALLLFPKLWEGKSGGSAGRAVTEPARRQVVCFATEDEPRLVLRPSFDLLEAAELDAKALDRALFPGGEEHRYYVLQLFGDDVLELDLSAEPVVLVTDGGARLAPILADPDFDPLPPYLRMLLASLQFGDEVVTLDPSRGSRVLLAYPAAALSDHASLPRVSVGARVLESRMLSKDELDTELEGEGEIWKAKKP